MKFGFVKTMACSPKIKVADVKFNTQSVVSDLHFADENGVELLVFPELCLSGATCGDLFYSDVLLNAVKQGINEICSHSKNRKMVIVVGAPIKKDGRIYDCAVVIFDGKILGVVPKTHFLGGDNLCFSTCPDQNSIIELNDEKVVFGNKVIFKNTINSDFTVGIEMGSDMCLPLSISSLHAINGANIIVNPSAFCETVGGQEFRQNTVLALSDKNACAYVLCNAGKGESTTDCVYSGHKIIAEKGRLLDTCKAFSDNRVVAEIDTEFLTAEKSKLFKNIPLTDGYEVVYFDGDKSQALPARTFEKTPFLPTDEKDFSTRANLILSIQAQGLMKRIEHTGAKSVVLGLSGGLDSTLAIIVAVNAIKSLNRPLKDVIAITMPCFGTTSRTFQNTIKLAKALGVSLKKIDITKSVERHLKDIKHADGVFDTTFENAQARERTQVLMDVSNMTGGLVIGTGDLSELALGWATYNGDHMSMYAVNCSIPKTLVRYVVLEYAKSCKGKLRAVLEDILDTPVSPELLPAQNDDINQKTEDIVGPYILHDFFLYHTIRRGSSPDKLYHIACNTFKGNFSPNVIEKWLKTFVRRFFNQQFKRSCVPDGVKVGSVSLSPRGDWKMPSDAVSALWLDQI